MTLFAAKPLTELLEKELTAQVIGSPANPGIARMFGFAVYHTLRSKGSAPGWPDWSCARERLVLLELKTMRGKVGDAQKEWIGGLLRANVETYIVRPDDLDDLALILAARVSHDTGLLTTLEGREARAVLLAKTREQIQ